MEVAPLPGAVAIDSGCSSVPPGVGDIVPLVHPLLTPVLV